MPTILNTPGFDNPRSVSACVPEAFALSTSLLKPPYSLQLGGGVHHHHYHSAMRGVEFLIEAAPDVVVKHGVWQGVSEAEGGNHIAAVRHDVFAHFDVPHHQTFDLSYKTSGGTARLVRTDTQLETFLKLHRARRVSAPKGIPNLRLLSPPSLLTPEELYAALEGEQTIALLCRSEEGVQKKLQVSCAALDEAASGGDAGRCFTQIRDGVTCLFSAVEVVSFTEEPSGSTVDIDDPFSASVFAAHITKHTGQTWVDLAQSAGVGFTLSVTHPNG